LGGRASQRTAGVNYSGAYADVAPEFLHKSHSVRVAFAAGRTKAPLALQFPLFGLALAFWVLLLTYMTNRFAGQIEADAPLALATAKIK
jgi:hypothetical protein